MNENISKKSNLRKKCRDFKKSKNVQNESNNYHVMNGLLTTLHFFPPFFYCVSNAVRAIFVYFDLFGILHWY
jgi:hypothetical protein